MASAATSNRHRLQGHNGSAGSQSQFFLTSNCLDCYFFSDGLFVLFDAQQYGTLEDPRGEPLQVFRLDQMVEILLLAGMAAIFYVDRESKFL